MALTTVKSDQIQTSVALAGSPMTTTQSASDNSTKIATTAYVETAVANLVDSAPASLNTLDELAAALNDDASFSTTVTNSIATKLPLAGGTLTGGLGIGAAVSTGYQLQLTGQSGYDDILRLTAVGTNIGARINLTNTGTGVARLNATNNSLALQTGGVTALTLDSSQNATFSDNVGIGGSPSHELDVISTSSGTSRTIRVASNASTGDNDATMIISNGGSGDAMLRFDYEGTNTDRARIGVSSSNQHLDFFTAGNNQRMRIHSNGAVSIANTRDYYGALNVEAGVISTNAPAIDIKASGTDKPIISFGDHNSISGDLRLTNNSRITLGTTSNHAFTFHTNGIANERMRIDNNGNVGIGTSSPSSYYANHLVVDTGSSAQSGITIVSDTNRDGMFAFADGTSGDARYRGYINYNHVDDSLVFGSAGDTRLTLDSSGNLLVGTTNTTWASQEGVRYFNGDSLVVTRSGGDGLYVNRLSSDGAIASFYKDGTSVGSISAISGDLAIHSTASGHEGLRFGNGAIVPTDNSGASTDNACNLGGATGRFSDLYLAGGAYLGGTGSANKLDDYEEGTWTPGVTGTGNSFGGGAATGRYTKVGRMVYLQLFINNDGSNTFGSGAYDITGLPFTAVNSSAQVIPTMAMVRYVTPPSGAFQLNTYTPSNQTKLQFYWSDTGNWEQLIGTHITSTSFAMYAGVVYEAA